jgi:hypothetical protein
MYTDTICKIGVKTYPMNQTKLVHFVIAFVLWYLLTSYTFHI